MSSMDINPITFLLSSTTTEIFIFFCWSSLRSGWIFLPAFTIRIGRKTWFIWILLRLKSRRRDLRYRRSFLWDSLHVTISIQNVLTERSAVSEPEKKADSTINIDIIEISNVRQGQQTRFPLTILLWQKLKPLQTSSWSVRNRRMTKERRWQLQEQ